MRTGSAIGKGREEARGRRDKAAITMAQLLSRARASSQHDPWKAVECVSCMTCMSRGNTQM